MQNSIERSHMYKSYISQKAQGLASPKRDNDYFPDYSPKKEHKTLENYLSKRKRYEESYKMN
jgi:hypothetical protein